MLLKFKDTPNRLKFCDYSSPGNYFITICARDREYLFGDVIKGKMVYSPAGLMVFNEMKNLGKYHHRIIIDEFIVMPNHVHCIIRLGDYGFNNDVYNRNLNENNESDNNRTDFNGGQIHEFVLTEQNGNNEDQNNNEFVLTEQNGNNENQNNNEFVLTEQNGNNENQNNNESVPTEWEDDFNEIFIKQYRKSRRKMIIPMVIGKLKMITSKQINLINQTPNKKNWQTDYYDHIIRDKLSYWKIRNYVRNNPKNWNKDLFYHQ